MEKKLTQINDKVNERLDDNFAKTNRTFTNILERLSKIDEDIHYHSFHQIY